MTPQTTSTNLRNPNKFNMINTAGSFLRLNANIILGTSSVWKMVWKIKISIRKGFLRLGKIPLIIGVLSSASGLSNRAFALIDTELSMAQQNYRQKPSNTEGLFQNEHQIGLSSHFHFTPVLSGGLYWRYSTYGNEPSRITQTTLGPQIILYVPDHPNLYGKFAVGRTRIKQGPQRLTGTSYLMGPGASYWLSPQIHVFLEYLWESGHLNHADQRHTFSNTQINIGTRIDWEVFY